MLQSNAVFCYYLKEEKNLCSNQTAAFVILDVNYLNLSRALWNETLKNRSPTSGLHFLFLFSLKNVFSLFVQHPKINLHLTGALTAQPEVLIWQCWPMLGKNRHLLQIAPAMCVANFRPLKFSVPSFDIMFVLLILKRFFLSSVEITRTSQAAQMPPVLLSDKLDDSEPS